MKPDEMPSRRKFFDRFRLLRPYRIRLAFAYLLLLLTASLQLFYPSAIAFFIDRSVPGSDTTWIAWAGAAMTAVLLAHALAIAIRHYLFASTGSMVVTDLRDSFFDAVVRQDGAFFDSESVGDLTNRLSADIEHLQEALTTDAAMLVQTAAIGAGASVMLFLISPAMSALILIVAPLVVLSMRWIGSRARALSKMRQEKLAHCGKLAQEVFSNIRLVHAFTQEEREKRRFRRSTASALRYALSGARLFAGMTGGATFVQSIALLATVLAGGRLIAQQALTLGEFTQFLLYAGMAAGSANSLAGLWGEWMRVVGATDRVFDLLSAPSGAEPCRAGSPARLEREIRFEGVDFRYPTRPERSALRNFSLTIHPGEKIALVGASGAGKSSVVNLLLGFYRPTSGRILVDGIDMTDLDLAAVRAQIAVVEQEPALFSTSILDNIRYGSSSASVGTEEALYAARHANVHEFVSSFPEGYETRVGPHGRQLSGGQKQRVAIARALIRDPRLLILDEATSALDAESEASVQEAMSHVMAGRTTVIIAHRLSTIAFADRIVVLRDGEIVQCGSHHELMECGDGDYRRLVSRQLSGTSEAAPKASAAYPLAADGEQVPAASGDGPSPAVADLA